MSIFNKLVDQVDDVVFNTVNEYLEDVIGAIVREDNTTVQEVLLPEITNKVLVALLKKYRPENVIFVEEEENVPEQVIYGVYNVGVWCADVSGATEGELSEALVDAFVMDDDDILFDKEFTIGDKEITFTDKFGNHFKLKKK